MKSKYFFFEEQHNLKYLEKYHSELANQTGKYRVMRSGCRAPFVYCTIKEAKGNNYKLISLWCYARGKGVAIGIL